MICHQQRERGHRKLEVLQAINVQLSLCLITLIPHWRRGFECVSSFFGNFSIGIFMTPVVRLPKSLLYSSW